MGRNKEEIAFNKYRCKKAGVKVVYTAESIPSTPEGVILESVLEGMAEYYSLQLSPEYPPRPEGQRLQMPEHRGQPAPRLPDGPGQAL